MRNKLFYVIFLSLCAANISWNWSGSVVPSATDPGHRVESQKINRNEIRIRDEVIDADEFTYVGYVVRKRHTKVRIDGALYGGRPFYADDTYATLRRKGRRLFKFDGIYAPMGNGIDFGVFSFLGRKRKQLFVSQDTFRGGNQWVMSLGRSSRVIYDGSMWNTGREIDDMSVADLDGDGVYEILVPSTIFYGFANLSPAATPSPTIIFKYSTRAGKYLPANAQFADYLLARIEERKERVRPADQVNQMNHLGDILAVVLDYTLAGRQQEAWTFYDQAYKLPDKNRIKREIQAELRDSPVYRFIYRKHTRHTRS